MRLGRRPYPNATYHVRFGEIGLQMAVVVGFDDGRATNARIQCAGALDFAW